MSEEQSEPLRVPVDLDLLEVLWKRRHQPSTCTEEQHDHVRCDACKDDPNKYPDGECQHGFLYH